MLGHPENSPEVNAIANAIGEMKFELVDVWCNGCNAFRKMNANFAKHLNGEIQSCAKCRGLKIRE